VVAELARDEDVGARAHRGLEQLAPGARGDGDPMHRCVQRPGHHDRVARERSLHAEHDLAPRGGNDVADAALSELARLRRRERPQGPTLGNGDDARVGEDVVRDPARDVERRVHRVEGVPALERRRASRSCHSPGRGGNANASSCTKTPAGATSTITKLSHVQRKLSLGS
jgi:hypothetical protein